MKTPQSTKKISAFAALGSKIKAAGGETRTGKVAKKYTVTEKQKKIPCSKKFRQSLRVRKSNQTDSTSNHEQSTNGHVKRSSISAEHDLKGVVPGTSHNVRKKRSSNSLTCQDSVTTAPPPKRKYVSKKPPVKTDICYQEEPGTSLTALLQELPAAGTDSAAEAEKLFRWLISPVTPDDFFNGLWEKKPLLLKRHMPDYNADLFSCEELHNILRENDLQFTTNIDVTTYSEGKRQTHNPVGRAHAPVVWDFYKNGCSVRLLNPQTYSDAIWKLNSLLQEYFGSFVGANIYLTPAGSQGFAPHYDDIEAFVLQLEGKKYWRLYSPKNSQEVLPRFSSANFTQEEIGEPIFDTVLEPGDLLYFPRGTIHQASTPEDSHSLHITLSTCQCNTWGDLLEKLLPQTLQTAMSAEAELRQSLPRGYMQYTGIANSESTDPRRITFLSKVSEMMIKLAQYAVIDDAADQMARGVIHDSLPPKLSQDEHVCSIFGSGPVCKNGKVSNEVEIREDTQIRIVRRGVVRLIAEDDQVRVYHTLENSRVYHSKQPQFVEIPAEAASAVEYLLHTYPAFTDVSSLPLVDEWQDKQVELAQVLYERGIVVSKKPLQPA
ncbi:ribosomal oxygenase 1-like [Acanthaster planci]|uniref:Bifunctional lysine-specific demethylase and histidyl-hydroxylase n=1 Tax=Acanthaster planci TaxID=133434 RepID=A0A8B7YTS1_ACAPL|nr:ribosomal oxygenase 1-like [Acanthaster planci]